MNSSLSLFRLTAVLVACVGVLAGCFGIVAAGAGAGALMLTDRRISETYIADEGIEMRAAKRIAEKYGEQVHVNLTSYNRMLLMTGEVPNPSIKSDIERLVSGVPNIKSIGNELAIAGPSNFGSRSNDSYITSKVKARFVDSNKFSANHVKVVTEAGVVFLLGMVTAEEAKAAVEIARTTGGVLKVVRVFESITPEQARELDSKPPLIQQTQFADPPAAK